jgi:hypothetical protein
MIPVYGFVEGDTLGLVVLVDMGDTVRAVADRLQDSASVRVARRAHVRVLYEGAVADPNATIASLGVRPLDRIDVREAEP